MKQLVAALALLAGWTVPNAGAVSWAASDAGAVTLAAAEVGATSRIMSSADDYRWAVQPSSATGPTGRDYFVYDVRPGQTITDYVGVTNLGGDPLTVNIYGTDAFTTPDGSFALLTADRAASDVGTWIAVSTVTHTIGPGARVDVPIAITVPTDATPGDHVGGVIGSVSGEALSGTGQRIKVDRRVAARVYLRVAGPLRPALQFDALDVTYDNPVNPFAGGGAEITYTLRNTGNVRLGAGSEVSLAGPLGWTLGTRDKELPEVLPGSTLTIKERFANIFPAGRITATVSLAPRMAVSEPIARATGRWAVPWLLAAALALAAVVVTIRIRRRRR
ncbi:protein of unknown function [Nonomuraea solani]|uniref:DUF916 domain-containing protein n=1 Tax=Nonomuraea solani TaxID=1144553 RepID=A0A1H6BSX7_9ACTN|nr:DUF916 domain-containing protein [Nonomuraea solani]SEG63555.1 protein of unknown function [Nonomuraea solani]